MAASEEGSVENEDDEDALLMELHSIKRRHTLDEAEEDLANTLGSDLPWLPGSSPPMTSQEPSRSPSHEHEGSNKVLSVDEGDLLSMQVHDKY
jgi:hypothetical protein